MSSLDPEALFVHRDFLRGIARAMLADVDHADDAVQQTFLRALTHPPQRHGVRAWLATVLKNIVRNQLRGQRRRESHERNAVRRLRVPTPEEIAEREALRKRVLDAVLALDEPYRTTVLLRWFEDRTPNEIARELEISPTTVRTRLHRALARLRARLDALHDGDRKAWTAVLAPLALGSRPVVAACVAWAVPLSVATMKKTILALVSVLLFAALAVLTWQPNELGGPGAVDKPSRPVGSVQDRGPAEPEVVPTRSRASTSGEIEAGRTGSLVIHVRYGSDGTAARNVLVLVGKPGEWLPNARRGRTDDAGSVRFDDLAPQRVLVSSDRGYGQGEIDVVVGKTVEMQLQLPRGVRLTGTVVGRGTGLPVAGATVELAVPTLPPRAVATTDGRGRFVVRDAPVDCYVAARAVGYAASQRSRVRERAGDSRDLRLELAGPGGSVEGLVAMADGHPVAGAAIRIGPKELNRGWATQGPAFAAFVRTNAEGRFRAIGLPAGTHSVSVFARGFAPCRGECEVVAHVTTSTVLVVSSGAVVIDALKRPFGTASRHVLVNPDTPTTCVLQLSRGLVLEGRVVDQHAGAVADAWITCAEPDNPRGWIGQSRTDSDGRFSVGHCPERMELVVRVRGTGIDYREQKHVDPRAGEVVITVHRLAAATAKITGRVFDEFGKPIAGAKVFGSRASGLDGTEIIHTANDGSFELGPLRPGMWTVVIRAAGLVELTRKRKLTERAHWDVGTVRLESGGRALVRIRTPDGKRPSFDIWTANGRSVGDAELLEGELRTPVLAPGRYSLAVYGKGLAAEAFPFTIRTNETTKLEVAPRPGIERRIELVVPAGIESRYVYVFVRNDKTTIVSTAAPHSAGRPCSKSVWLGPGDYTVIGRTADLEGRSRLHVARDGRDQLHHSSRGRLVQLAAFVAPFVSGTIGAVSACRATAAPGIFGRRSRRRRPRPCGSHRNRRGRGTGRERGLEPGRVPCAARNSGPACRDPAFRRRALESGARTHGLR